MLIWLILLFLVLTLAACQPSATENNPGTAVPEQSQPSEQSINDTSVQAPDGQPSASSGADTAVQPPTSSNPTTTISYPIVDTNQHDCYSDQTNIACPTADAAFYGQDAQYQNAQPAYQNNGDGTITDLNTGLMWQQTPDINGDGQIDVDDKMDFETALQNADSFNLAGYSDWRLPTIKELYSLMDFSGVTSSQPYINTDYFGFGYGDEAAGERDIDAQFASSTLYVSEVMNGRQAMFGLNLADGRIKGYPTDKLFYVLYVRGDSGYGINDFVDNGDGTISDQATGLTWMQTDSGAGLNWEEALSYCENLDYAGISDWRLPNAKELQSIVDYGRSLDTTGSAAIDPLFQATLLPNGVNDSGEANYAHYWSSTTHLDGRNLGSRGVYVAFGEARGVMNGQLMDVHGAGAQRSDLKSGDPASLPVGFGPQGDVQSIYNYARCVIGGVSNDIFTGDEAVPMGNSQVGTNQPDNMPGAPNQAGPPQEAIAACNGLASGAACTVNTPNGNISGTCNVVASGELACIPEGGGGRP